MSELAIQDRQVREQPRESLSTRMLGSAVESLLITPSSPCARTSNEISDVSKALKDMNPSELFRSVSHLAVDVAKAAVSPLGTAAQLGLEGVKSYYDHKSQDAFLANLVKHDVNYQGPPRARFDPEKFDESERFRVLEKPRGAYIYEKEYMERMPKDNRQWTPAMSEEFLRKALKDK